MTVSCVYWIRRADHTDLMTQGYVGVSGRFDRRMWEHFKLNGNRHLNFAIEKYGWDNLIKTKILIADQDYCLDTERKLRPADNVGWNCVAGGGKPPLAIGNKFRLGIPSWNKGKIMSLETRQKISAAAKEQWEREGMRELLSSAKKGKVGNMAGKKHRPASIEKMRLAHTGKVSKKKGRMLTDEQKANLSKLIRLKPWACPHCQTVGYNTGAGNRWHFDNCKKKEY